MSLVVTKDNCTLTITWPASCCSGLNRLTLKFVVIVRDVESGYEIVTTPLLAHSLVLRVGVPPYFCSSPRRLVVTVHLCQPLVDKTGWTTMESLSTCAVPSDDELHDESECEHGPAGSLERSAIIFCHSDMMERQDYRTMPKNSYWSGIGEVKRATNMGHGMQEKRCIAAYPIPYP